MVSESESNLETRWRTGRSVGRTVYKGDDLVGLMDTPALAERVVKAVNLQYSNLSISDQARALLGQRVKVTLGEEDGAPVIATGLLLGVGPYGDFEIQADDNLVHYCWPMLNIERET